MMQAQQAIEAARQSLLPTSEQATFASVMTREEMKQYNCSHAEATCVAACKKPWSQWDQSVPEAACVRACREQGNICASRGTAVGSAESAPKTQSNPKRAVLPPKRHTMTYALLAIALVVALVAVSASATE